MRGKNLVISLITIVALLAPIQAAAQECRYLPEDEGGKHHIIIDGEVYFYLPLEKSKELQKKAEDYPLVVKKNKLLEEEVTTLKDIKDVQGSTIERLEGESEFTHEFVKNAWKQPQTTPWYKSNEVSFITGVVFAAGMYALWAYADNELKN